jgi:hypothetical protein
MSKKTEKAAEVEANDPTPRLSKSEQLAKYKERYTPYVTPTGVSMDNGDEVATTLRGASPEVVIRAAEKLKQLEPGALAMKYADRNNGAKRMNAGNIIRGFIRRGDLEVAGLKKLIKESNAEIHKA